MRSISMANVYDVTSAFVDELVEQFPTLATYLGVPGHDHLWNDYSVAGAEAEIATYRDQLARLDATTVSGKWETLAEAVVRQAVNDELSQLEADDHLRDLNSIASPLQSIRDIFDFMDESSAAGWSDIASRLTGVPDALGGYRERLELGRRRGLVVARRQAVEGARQARNHSGEESFFATLPGRMASKGFDDAALVSRLEVGVEAARRGYRELAEYLEGDYLPDTEAKDGVGRDQYVRAASRFLGTELDPESTYDWGWSEVARLRARMEETAQTILPGGSLDEVLDLLQNDPERATETSDEFRALMQERQVAALAELEGTHFDVPEQVRHVDVKLAPPGGSLGAYYVDPSEDYTRPGSVWWSLGEKEKIPLFDQVSTAYHEGFPGHHLQVVLQMTAGDRFSRYQKLLTWYPGTGEGWALYAEDLMEEWGYLEDPDYLMGKLASEMLRAARVVIDIGSHLDLPIPSDQPFHPGEAWSFDLGVEMLEQYAAQDHDTSVSEMNRYLGWPGQAIAYKVGQQAIRDLREEARDRDGDDFDAKAFHHRLLEVGSTGLDVLRSHMRDA